MRRTSHLFWVICVACGSATGSATGPSDAGRLDFRPVGRCTPADPCDDGDPCTVDSCESYGCRYQPVYLGPCDDYDACTIEDACDSGKCRGIPRNCDDGNSCTKDGCHPVSGCYHEIDDDALCCDGGVSWCDDGSPCTTDTCDPETFDCIHTPNAAACDDFDSCTVNDSCNEGHCLGTPKACDDGNPCTSDMCSEGECKHVALASGPCDDGLACSVGDHCVQGVCVADKSGCGCDPDFHDPASKVVKMWIPAKGNPGDGLDVDGNPNTCKPDDNCSGGVDNALGPLAAFGADSIQQALDMGQTILLMEHRGLKTDGTPFTLAIYAGRLDPSNAGCDFQHAECAYQVSHANLTPDCKPLAALDNAKVVGGKLYAGGKGGAVPFEMPLFGGVTLHVDLINPKVEATLTLKSGKVSVAGLMAGAVPLTQLKKGIMHTPDAFWPKNLPPKDQVVALVDVLVKPDIDGNGDSVPESASIAVHFEAIPALLTGVF